MDTRRVKRAVKFFFSKTSKLIFIISSRKCLTLLKAEKVLKLAVNTAVKAFEKWQEQELLQNITTRAD